MIRTDLAKEACEGLKNMDGTATETRTVNGLEVTAVHILSAAAARETGKPVGTYVTIESDALSQRNTAEYENLSRTIAEELKKLLGCVGEKATVLVAGLGNERMTPDSIGPRVVHRLLVTRHLFEYLPESADERLRPVCALAPGVLGVTGIESADVISSLCDRLPVSLVIVIDALAARRSERIFSTVQISDTGVEPGAGVGNKRRALNRDALGVPVLALGVPTVVYASTLVTDALEEQGSTGEKAEAAARAALGDMVVTPKEIDVAALDTASVLADALNLALHPKIPLEELHAYLA